MSQGYQKRGAAGHLYLGTGPETGKVYPDCPLRSRLRRGGPVEGARDPETGVTRDASAMSPLAPFGGGRPKGREPVNFTK